MPLKGLLLVSFAHEIGRGLVFEYEYDVVSVYAVKIKIMLAAQEFLCRNAEFYLFIVRLDIEGFLINLCLSFELQYMIVTGERIEEAFEEA